jgi:serine/threonine-protein kinase HipA
MNIPAAEYRAMVEQLCEAAVDTGREVAQAARDRREWRQVAKNMIHAWNQGMEAVRSAKPNVALRGLNAVIQQERFSAPDKPEPPEKLGRSPLLPKGRGRAF